MLCCDSLLGMTSTVVNISPSTAFLVRTSFYIFDSSEKLTSKSILLLFLFAFAIIYYIFECLVKRKLGHISFKSQSQTKVITSQIKHATLHIRAK